MHECFDTLGLTGHSHSTCFDMGDSDSEGFLPLFLPEHLNDTKYSFLDFVLPRIGRSFKPLDNTDQNISVSQLQKYDNN